MNGKVGASYLRAKKIRSDKIHGNSAKTANDNWQLFHEPITEEDLKGETLFFIRRYHNQIKRQLLELLPTGLNLLDIGGGYGQDIWKWGKFKKIISLEPDADNRKKFEKRVKENVEGNSGNIKILPLGGENTKEISRNVLEIVGDKVDVITLMLSLTFFWKDEDMLNSLVKTIKENLKPGGHILYLTLNGQAVESMMDPIWGDRKLDNPWVEKSIYMKLYPKESGKGRRLDVKLEGTIVGGKSSEDKGTGYQVEYLVNMDDLMMRLGSDFTNLGQYIADEEMFMSAKELILSSMYVYGVIYRKF